MTSKNLHDSIIYSPTSGLQRHSEVVTTGRESNNHCQVTQGENAATDLNWGRKMTQNVVNTKFQNMHATLVGAKRQRKK